MRRFSIVILVATLSACGNVLEISHSETPCITAGQVATLTTKGPPGTVLTYEVKDDFGASLTPAIPPITIGSSGEATARWQSPPTLTTTAVHFDMTAKNGGAQTNRDIHVEVAGNGRSC